MKSEQVFMLGVLSFLIGVMVLWLVLLKLGVGDPPADRYTVAELTDAIATREADFAERAVELEESK